MVNGFSRVDFYIRGARGICQVDITPEDIEYSRVLEQGRLVADGKGGVVFQRVRDGQTMHVKTIGPLETFFEDSVNGQKREVREGVIGGVARRNDCNAYEMGETCLIGNAEHQAAATSFRVYGVSEE